MKPEAEDLLAFCRLFGMSTRNAVCCGDVSVAQCVALQLFLANETATSSLAETTGVTKGAITRLVDGLDKRGWISRQTDEIDGRRITLSLTKSGKKKAKELGDLTEKSIALLLSSCPPASVSKSSSHFGFCAGPPRRCATNWFASQGISAAPDSLRSFAKRRRSIVGPDRQASDRRCSQQRRARDPWRQHTH